MFPRALAGGARGEGSFNVTFSEGSASGRVREVRGDKKKTRVFFADHIVKL